LYTKFFYLKKTLSAVYLSVRRKRRKGKAKLYKKRKKKRDAGKNLQIEKNQI